MLSLATPASARRTHGPSAASTSIKKAAPISRPLFLSSSFHFLSNPESPDLVCCTIAQKEDDCTHVWKQRWRNWSPR